VAFEESLEDSAHLIALVAGQKGDRKNLPAACVANCQRLALLPVLRSPPSLEVDRPEIVRCLHLDVRPSIRRPKSDTGSAALDLAESGKNARNRAPARSLVAKLRGNSARDCVSAPARMPAAELEDRDDDILPCRERTRTWSPALINEAEVTLGTKPPKPLVSRLPRDPVLAAQR
jgi:hypothetical protein